MEIKHIKPMLSLSKTWELKDLIIFDNQIKKQLENYNYVCELKIDGVAISLKYKNGSLEVAATRGNGLIGYDVTDKIKTIKETLKINSEDEFEVRGEVYINKKDFKNINNQRPDEGKPEYITSRCLTAGTLNQKEVDKINPLKLFIYTLLSDQMETQFKNLKKIKELGFRTEKHSKECSTIEAVIEFCKYWKKNKSRLPYDIDGVAVKINSIEQQNKLGQYARWNNWQIAYKF